MHDLVIRGGTIVDGSGAARFAADIAIDGGCVSFTLVLTTSANTPDQILTRKTDVYYIEDVDNTLFRTAPEHKTMKVVNQ